MVPIIIYFFYLCQLFFTILLDKVEKNFVKLSHQGLENQFKVEEANQEGGAGVRAAWRGDETRQT